MTTIDPTAEERLRNDLVGWLTTVARDGTPQSSPVAYLWDGAKLTIWSEPDAPKVTNLVENHRCSFHLNSDEYGLAVVAIEGIVHLPPDGLPGNEVPAFVTKYAEVFGRAWPGDIDEAARRYSQQIVLTPHRIRVW